MPSRGKVVNGKYCVHCGAVVELTEKTGRAKMRSHFLLLHFINKNQTTGKENDWREKDVVLIHASLLLAVKGALIEERVSKLPVTVNISCYHIDLKKTIFDKFKRYNATVKKLQLIDVKLVYKSGEVIRFIPGTNIPFTVKAYKEDLGVSYHAIVLHLLPYEDLNDTDDEYADLPLSAL